MVNLSTLGDEAIALILEFDLLDLSEAERLSEDEVLRAVDLSLEMRAAKEGVSSSSQGNPPAAGILPAENQPLPTYRSAEGHNRGLGLWARLVGSKTEEQVGGSKKTTRKDGLTGLEDRNRLLAESEDENDADGEYESEPCAICGGGAGEKRRLSCDCLYCARCLRRCIRTGLRNEMDFPPRCHQRLTEEDIRWVNRPDLLRLYKQVGVEWDTPAEERVYCSKPECSAFIRDKNKRWGGEARCGVCGAGTCASCRKRWHPGLPCDERRENEELMNMMDEHGYAHCTRCGTIVDSLGGCNHMTCVCGHQFCYLCSAPWRTCSCPLIGEFGLRRPARERAQRYREGHDPNARSNTPQRQRPQPQRDELVIVDNGQSRIPANLYVPHNDLNAEPVREPERPHDSIERSAPIPIPQPRRREQVEAGYMTEMDEEMMRLYGERPFRPGGPPRDSYLDLDPFPNTPLPIPFFYSDQPNPSPPSEHDQAVEVSASFFYPRLPTRRQHSQAPDPQASSFNPAQPNPGGHDQAAEAPSPRTTATSTHHSSSERRPRPSAPNGAPMHAPVSGRMPIPPRPEGPGGISLLRMHALYDAVVHPDPFNEGNETDPNGPHIDQRRRWDISLTPSYRPVMNYNTTCIHQWPGQWAHAYPGQSRSCNLCRGGHRDRQLWRCRECGVQACQPHINRWFGLDLEDAEDGMNEWEERRRRHGREAWPRFF